MAKKVNYQLGTVTWFDDHTGKGIITDDDGIDYKVHYSSIESKSKWKSLEKNTKVKFVAFDDPDHLIAEKVLEVKL